MTPEKEKLYRQINEFLNWTNNLQSIIDSFVEKEEQRPEYKEVIKRHQRQINEIETEIETLEAQLKELL